MPDDRNPNQDQDQDQTQPPGQHWGEPPRHAIGRPVQRPGGRLGGFEPDELAKVSFEPRPGEPGPAPVIPESDPIGESNFRTGDAPIGTGQAAVGGAPIGTAEVAPGAEAIGMETPAPGTPIGVETPPPGAPIGVETPATGNPIGEETFTLEGPIGPVGELTGRAVGGAGEGLPIESLSGVFSNGLPIGGPVSQIFRGGGPEPNVLFFQTLSSAGPIGAFLIGSAGGPIGEDIFGRGGLPIGEILIVGGLIGAEVRRGGESISEIQEIAGGRPFS